MTVPSATGFCPVPEREIVAVAPPPPIVRAACGVPTAVGAKSTATAQICCGGRDVVHVFPTIVNSLSPLRAALGAAIEPAPTFITVTVR